MIYFTWNLDRRYIFSRGIGPLGEQDSPRATQQKDQAETEVPAGVREEEPEQPADRAERPIARRGTDQREGGAAGRVAAHLRFAGIAAHAADQVRT